MTDPIEQLAAEVSEQFWHGAWQDVGNKSNLLSTHLAKLIRVAITAAATHCNEFSGCVGDPDCMADICQRIREGMGK